MTGNHRFEKYMFGYDEVEGGTGATGIGKYAPRCVFCGLIDDRKLQVNQQYEQN